MEHREGQGGGDDAEPLEPALEELRARLAADLEALSAAVGNISQAQADWRPAPARWSVGETLHHLVLSNRAFAIVARKLIQRGRREALTPGPSSRRSWPRLRSIADVSASGPVKNPERVTPTHGLPIEQLRRELAESHYAVLVQIPALGALELAELKLPHPLGFELNLYHWVDIAGAHERRHMAQIRATMAAPGFPPAAR
ncbi:MAG: DinB family protein [Thermoanaerobaculaceae bacterium]|jgi:hypothetical protein